MTDSQRLSSKNKSEEVRQRAFRLVLFLGIAGILAGLIFSNLSERGKEPLSLAASYGAGIVQLFGAFLIYKRRLFWGVIVAASTAPVVALLVMFQSAGIGTTIVIAELLIYMMILPLIITEEEGLSRIQVGAVVAAAMMVLVDQYWPYPRNAMAPELIRATYIFLFVLLAVFAVVLIRRFPTFTLRGKLVSTTLVVTTLAVTAVAFGASTISRNALTVEGSKQMQALSQSQGLLIGELLAREITALQTLALDDDLLAAVKAQNDSYSGSSSDVQTQILEQDSEWLASDNDDSAVQAVLQHPVVSKIRQFSAKFPENSNILLTDRYGALVAATQPTEQYYFAEEAWWEVAYNVSFGKTYVSDPDFNERSGLGYLQIALPLFSSQPNGPARLEGILYSRYSLQSLEDLMVVSQVGETQSIRVHLPGYELALDEAGSLQIHTDNFTAEEVLAGAQLADTSYTFTDADGVVHLLSVGFVNTLNHQPIVDDLDWLVSVRQAESEALASIAEQQRLNILLGIFVILAASAVAMFTGNRLTTPILRLTKVAQEVSAGNLDARAEVTSQDEMGILATVFNDMTAQVHELIHTLEQRVAARTRDLNLAAEIGRQVSQVRNLDALLPQAAQLVQEQFGLYQTQIYLVDESGERLVLRASTGHAGSQMLEAGHMLPIDENSLNGTAAVTKQAVTVANTTASPAFRPHPLLPDTRSEMAVPLLVGEKVVGVLDLQSDKPNALMEENLPAFETLSGQLAVAIQNAALLSERRQAEAQVRESEALMRTIIDSTPDWIFVKDLEHRYLVVNKAFAGTLQQAPEEVIGKHDLEIGIPEDLVHGDPEKGISGIWTGEREVMDSGQIRIVEEHAYTPDGQPISLSTVRVPLKDTEGHVSGVVGFIHNITDLKQAERELQAAHARTQEILESIYIPLGISNVSDGKIVYANEPMAEMFGVSREELQSWVITNIYHQASDRDGYVKTLREQGYVSNFELYLRRGNGEAFWALASGRIVNFQGQPAVITSAIDITDRRDAQATIVRRATELETVASVSTVAAASMEPEELMQQVVDLTQDRFNLYHAHIYLLNESKTDLVLTSGAGETGAKMVAEGRRISLDQKQSLVARAARNRVGVVSNNVQAEPGFLPHPLLPETRAEMAVPLVAGNEVLGVLDVQADQVDRFTSEDINIFTTLASQVAVALQNARRHNEALKALDELTRLQRIMVREGWTDYLTTQERPFFGYAFDAKGAKPIQKARAGSAAAEDAQSEQNGKIVETAVTTPDDALTIPIAVRGELVGKIALRSPDGTAIPERKQSLIQTVAQQVSEALERARLTEQTQRALQETNEQARRLALLNELSEAISRMTTIEDIASAIISKVPDILNAKRLRLYLVADENESMLRVVAAAGEVAGVREGERVPLAESPIAQALEKRQIVADLLTSGADTLLAYHVPLFASGRALGAFDVLVAANRELDEGNQQILLQIASLLSTTLENRRLFNQTKARADRERLLNNITQKIQSTVTMESALQTAVTELSEALKAKKAIIELSTTQNGEGHTQQ
ncbi:MAG: GAF domain-containing protein [Anaerolineaceae bacterium]|nr:GAF domain-containing protein [Anaerolineaceae bacterium]